MATKTVNGGSFSFLAQPKDPGSATFRVVPANVSAREGDLSILEFDYLVATPEGTRHFTERHEAMLFSDAQYRRAFERAGLAVEFDEDGLIGRGLYLGQPA